MGEVKIHPLEKLRRARGMTQRQVGLAVYASETTIRTAEQGKPIGRKYIDRLIAWSDGELKPEDFAERGDQNGKERTGQRDHKDAQSPKGRKQRPDRGRGARVSARSS